MNRSNDFHFVIELFDKINENKCWSVITQAKLLLFNIEPSKLLPHPKQTSTNNITISKEGKEKKRLKLPDFICCL